MFQLLPNCPHDIEPYFCCPKCELASATEPVEIMAAAIADYEDEYVLNRHTWGVEAAIEALHRAGFEIVRKLAVETP